MYKEFLKMVWPVEALTYKLIGLQVLIIRACSTPRRLSLTYTDCFVVRSVLNF